MHQHASFLHSDPNCSNLHGRVRDWGVAWWSAMHYELRLGETQSLNNVSQVTDTRETGPLPGEPPPLFPPADRVGFIYGVDTRHSQSQGYWDVEHNCILLLISYVGTISGQWRSTRIAFCMEIGQSNVLIFCVQFKFNHCICSCCEDGFCLWSDEDNPMTGRACSRLSGPEDDNLSGHRSFINSIQCTQKIYDPQIY